MRSRSRLLVMGMALILLFVNGQILWHERQLTVGHTVILKLMPQDPRSLLQGDYMQLRYEIADSFKPAAADGLVYLKPGPNGVAERPVSGSTTGAVPLKYRLHNGKVLFDIESFFFQEGMGSRYQRARYVELRVSSQGVPHIVQLRDENLEVL